MDASLQLSHLQLLDDGMYRCQLVHGIEDESVVVSLWVEGQLNIGHSRSYLLLLYCFCHFYPFEMLRFKS